MKKFVCALLGLMMLCSVACAEITQERVSPEISTQNAAMYQAFFAASEAAFVVPALKQDYVPQGMCYVPSENWMVLSAYTKSGAASIVSVVSLDDGALVKSVFLAQTDGAAYTGHAGGLAAGEKSLWVTTDGLAQRIALSDLKNAKDGDTLRFTDEFDTGTRASVATCGQSILWVGDFYTGNGSYPTDKSHHMKTPSGARHYAWVVGYKLDPSAEDEIGDKTPDYVLSVPDQVQGMTVLPSGEILLSTSYGRNNTSYLAHFMDVLATEPHDTVTLNGVDVPLWYLDETVRIGLYAAPPMAEAVACAEGETYLLLESGASIYKNGRCPLDDVYTVSLESLGKK